MIEHRPAGVTTSAPVTAPDAARRRTMARALDAEAARNREQLARDRAQRARSNRPVTDREVRQVVAVLLNRKAVPANLARPWPMRGAWSRRPALANDTRP